MPYPASQIAAAFVRKAIEEGNPITQMKLQKMVYFAHGYNLAKYDKPLLNESIQAWKFGPVVPIIYDNYKLYGNLPISSLDLVRGDFKNSDSLGADAMEAVDYTWEATKHLSASDLSAWSHMEGSPWANAYSQYDWAIPITDESIAAYFKQFLY
jgi:uncharacterized phage-associated protein